MKRKIIALIAVVALALSLTACGSTKINMKDYVTVDIVGYDGYAKAEMTVDSEAINACVDNDKLAKKLAKLDKGNELWEQMASMYMLSDLVSVELAEEYTDLSNGDVVKVEVKVNPTAGLSIDMQDLEKTIGVKFSPVVMEYPVEGLEEAKVIDLAQMLKDRISVSGVVSGAGRISYDFEGLNEEFETFVIKENITYRNKLAITNKDGKYIAELKFEVDDEYDSGFTVYSKYINGDTITLKITGDGVETLKMEGYVITDTIEITVEGLPEHITSVEQLTDEMKSEAMDRINADFERHSKYIFNAWRNCSVEDFYWGTIKPDATVYNELDLRDRLCIVATYEIDGKQYKIAYYPDIIIFEDGSYQMNIDYMDGFYCNNNVFYENYDFEEIEEW